MQEKLDLGDLFADIFKAANQDRSFLVKIVQNLKPEYFESRVFSVIFKTYQEFFKRFDKEPTRKMVSSALQKKFGDDKLYSTILDYIYSDTIMNPVEKQYVHDEVISFGKKKKMESAVLESVNLLEQNKFGEIQEIIKEALIFNMNVDVGVDLYDVDERYLRLRNSLDNRAGTGFSQIDRILEGGWAKKELYSLMGPPGIGKSVFLPNFGIKALMNGLNVAHYSMEMSEERLGLRYDSIATGITTSSLMDHPDEIKKKYETFKHITGAKLKLKEFPTGAASVMDIEAHLEQLKIYEDFEPDMLIIDYGDIMRSTRKTANTYEEQGWIFRELRGLAVKKNLVVITATQANRESMDNDGGTKEIIGMNQTADSMEKNRILDGLFTITQKRQEKDQGKINLWVAKNRNGPSNILLQFLINYNTFKITEALLGSGAGPSSTENEDLDIEA